ncbi:universal stress protein [Nocardioides sp.]|uniref:universal stress protein n=1 Tax=Nocardioides sp. TaxID=35761 RepID=UPI0035147A7C
MDQGLLSDLPRGAVIVGVDGSPPAERALDHAAAQAAQERRPLVVAAAREWEKHGAEAITADAAGRAITAHPGLSVTTLVDDGDPRLLFLDLSRHAHLLVLGSRGRGPVRSLLLGSVSATTARITECPLHVVRPRDERDPAEGSRAGVLVAADGAPESRPVLEHAFAQAELLGVPLHVVHWAWDAAAALSGTDRLRVADTEELSLLLAEGIAGLSEKHPDVSVTLGARHGLVDAALAADSARWDLVVVGRHPLDSLARLVTGSVATAVLERAHTTVAVVPIGR